MKKLFDDDENGFQEFDKAKILVTVIPFVLIIIILAITLLVNSCNNKKAGQENENLQESIMEYADEKLKEMEKDAMASPFEQVSQEKPEVTPSATDVPTAIPTAEPSPTPYKEAMKPAKDYSKIKFETQSQLKEMMSYWSENNQKALDDLVNLDRNKAMSWSLKGTENYYYYGDVNAAGKPHGVGIAVYADNRYYYGDWENGLRSGNGTWMHYHIHESTNKTDLYTYHQYTGGWKNDLPDGEGSEHYDYEMELLEDWVGYDTNLIGHYKEGLVHGEFFITNIYSDGNIKEWKADAEMGAWVIREETPKSSKTYPVYEDIDDENNYIYIDKDKNRNISVPCLNISNKN